MSTKVSNVHPTVVSNFKLAVVGDCPDRDSEAVGVPFVGPSGKLLHSLVGQAGFSLRQCYYGYVCGVRPPDGNFENLAPHGPQITTGLEQLAADFEIFKPNCVLLLGQNALNVFKQEYEAVSNYRGSLFEADGRISGFKALSTLDTDTCLRTWNQVPFVRLDIAKARRQAEFPDLALPNRISVLRPGLDYVLTRLAEIRTSKQLTSFDVEGYCDNVGVTMVSFVTNPLEGFVIPFWIDGGSYWSEDEEVLVWQAIAAVLEDPTVPKVCQNALYECFILAWKHKIIVQGISEDTMYGHWELFPEFKKNLGLQTSIYTDEPYYKEERLSDDSDVKLEYNFKDSAVTLEIQHRQAEFFQRQPRSFDHYRFNIELIPAFNYMHLRGCKLDMAVVSEELEATITRLNIYQADINHFAGKEINVKSAPAKQWLLYEKLGCESYKRYGRTTREEIIHRLRIKYNKPILNRLVQAINARTRISDIGKLVPAEDGRIRTSYDPTGTPTGRLNSRASPALRPSFTKTGILKWQSIGTNLQNQTKDVRRCYVPDSEDYWFYQSDLSGADGWTVAADLAALGFPTMLDDYRFGIKPAKVLLLMLEAHETGKDPAAINTLSRPDLKALVDAIQIPTEKDVHGRPGDWKYLCMKRVQHGSNYDAKAPTIADTIFKDSDGLVDISSKEAGVYQWFYKLRYNTSARVEYIERELRTKGVLTAACGITRRFYDIRYGRVEPTVLRSALSFEPQANTTWATNAALHKLWYDPENRKSTGGLFIEPLLQIHDAIGGQFKKRHIDFARRKIPEWFNNPLKIHGIEVNIPAETGIGPNWKETYTEL